MSRRTLVPSCSFLAKAASVLACILAVSSTSVSRAGNIRNSAVGGIAIDAAGVVRQQTEEDRTLLYQWLKTEVGQPPAEIAHPVSLRMVSLRALESALDAAQRNNYGLLPEEMKFLAGIQRVQYVFLYPERNDIVLAGPGEGWRIDEDANVVGVTTGRPVLLLDDLLVALRSVRNARQGSGISCSIDPTAEGRRRFEQYQRNLRTFREFSRTKAEQALGPQRITITGVPGDSHFARVLVAADYWMKRYAMALSKPPLAGLPSFLDLMKKKRALPQHTMPRWWLACNYQPVGRSEDGLAWRLRGTGVQVMTEDDLISKTGAVKSAGRKNPIAQQWAEMATARYEELSQANPVFGELRNLMDLCVVAALIEKEDMLNRVGLSIPRLARPDSDVGVDRWHTPKTVASQCTFVKVGRRYIIAASGGVQIDSWAVASKSETDHQVAPLRNQAKPADRNNKWWWN